MGFPLVYVSAGTTSPQLVSSTPRNIEAIVVANKGTSMAYLKLYNKATAPVAGTDTPVAIIPIPASGGAVFPLGMTGMYFSIGLGFTITGDTALLDATSVTAANVTVTFIPSGLAL